MSRFNYDLRVIWATIKKEVKSGLSQRLGTIMGVFLPVNFLILLSLFAIGGGLAPTAVVMNDTGPYAQQFYDAMANAHSFRLQQASAQEAQDLIQAGRIVAVVTIPADFDTQLQNNASVQVDVQINNLNTDFTNDIRRAIPLSITSFYGKAFPNVVSITAAEHDLQPQDTDYIPYLTVSILVIALMFGCILQSGMPAAHEWETSTIKELLLSPASRWAITIGQMAGALILALLSAVVVLVILIIFVGVWPAHWDEVIGFALLTMVIFIAWGTLLGTLVKRRQSLAALALGVSLPLFFVSGPFGPVSFFTGIVPVIAQLFPPYYAIVLQQHAFHGFDLNTYGVAGNALILGVYTVALVIVTALVLRRSTVAN